MGVGVAEAVDVLAQRLDGQFKLRLQPALGEWISSPVTPLCTTDGPRHEPGALTFCTEAR